MAYKGTAGKSASGASMSKYDVEVEGRKVGMRFGEIEMSVPLGITTFATTGVLRDVILKRL